MQVRKAQNVGLDVGFGVSEKIADPSRHVMVVHCASVRRIFECVQSLMKRL